MGESIREFLKSLVDPGQCPSDEPQPTDGGLPPGGTWPERGPCEAEACPTCASEQSMSSPCVYQSWHEGDHQCAYGHYWGPGAQAACHSTCPQDGQKCQLDDLHTSAGIPHEHGGGGVSHKW
jgi:hypothetical protein